jgi:hypothetical protein
MVDRFENFASVNASQKRIPLVRRGAVDESGVTENWPSK